MSFMMCNNVSPDFFDALHIVSLFGVEWRIQYQAGHSSYSIHGRAYFMAHVGQELLLELFALLCSVLCHL